MHITACSTSTKSNAPEGSAKSLFLAAMSSASVEGSAIGAVDEGPIAEEPRANAEGPTPSFIEQAKDKVTQVKVNVKDKVIATVNGQKKRRIYPQRMVKQIEGVKENLKNVHNAKKTFISPMAAISVFSLAVYVFSLLYLRCCKHIFDGEKSFSKTYHFIAICAMLLFFSSPSISVVTVVLAFIVHLIILAML
eukprot:114489_1